MSVGSIGALLCQIPSGWLVFRIGGRNALAFSLFSSALVNLITPLCAQINYYLFLLTRLLFGFLSSFLVVAIISLWGNWAPKNERSFLLGIGAAGSQIGPTIGFSLGSYLCINGFDGGWPSIFYYSGAAGVVWSILFVLLITESPETLKFISEREKLYIMRETAESRKSKHQTKSLKTQEEWTIVFYLTATIYLLGGLPAIIFVNSKTEDWAKEKTIDDKIENEDDIVSGIN